MAKIKTIAQNFFYQKFFAVILAMMFFFKFENVLFIFVIQICYEF